MTDSPLPFLVAVPSKGRPTDQPSKRYITAATLFVPELEVNAYRRAGHFPVIPVPNDVIGITKTRNFIIDYAVTHNYRWLVFIDDDLKTAGYVEMYSHTMKHRKITESVMISEWTKIFEMTEQLGYRLWGLSTQSAPRAFYPWRPFIFHSYVTASCCGLILDPSNPLHYDESYPVKEDYELCLRLIRDDDGILGARYLYWENDHWTKPGGCKDYRTQDAERKATERLIESYPGFIRRVRRGGSEFSIELDF